ncbi:MAG: CoA-binding protein [Gemmatimonadota bacterium]
MDPIERLRAVLASSSDPANPDAEAVAGIIDRVHRVAVVGLSRDPTKAARRVPSYMAAKGYEIIPVNPHADRLLGREARPSLRDVPEPVDMVVVFRPSEEARRIVDVAAARSERPVIWLQEGIRADVAAAAARAAGLTVVQDLCFYKAHRALHETAPRPAAER